MTWDWGYAIACLPVLLTGLGVSCIATAGGAVLALLLGIAAAIAMRGWRPLAWLVDGAATAVRSTPLLVQLYILFYALPQTGLAMPALLTGIIAMGIHYAAYVAEVLRAGIGQVPGGQWDAGRALGLPRRILWLRIILPQAIRPVLPALANQGIAMLKDTPLLSTITVIELLGAARMIGTERFRYLEPLTLVGVLFLAVTLLAAIPARRLELHIGRMARP